MISQRAFHSIPSSLISSSHATSIPGRGSQIEMGFHYGAHPRWFFSARGPPTDSTSGQALETTCGGKHRHHHGAAPINRPVKRKYWCRYRTVFLLAL